MACGDNFILESHFGFYIKYNKLLRYKIQLAMFHLLGINVFLDESAIYIDTARRSTKK